MTHSLMTQLRKEGLILATTNLHKRKEIQSLLSDLGIDVYNVSDFLTEFEIEENAQDFQGNALLKARACFEKTNRISLADDSGLEVKELGGRPGVLSARYGGEGLDDMQRNLLLLKEMKNIPDEKRAAQFVCVLALCYRAESCIQKNDTANFFYKEKDLDKNTKVLFFIGECKGSIAQEISGKNGFGYDPIFIDTNLNKTFAELSFEEKNQHSHRAEALKKFKKTLELFDLTEGAKH